MKVYTRRGDGGQTALFGGEQVDKDSPRVAAYGTVDELNSFIGLAQAFCHHQRVRETLKLLQNQLFQVGADLASRMGTKSKIGRIAEADWRHLENVIDQLDQELPPLKHFILPAGSAGASCLHLARAVCRRAEREVVNLTKLEGDVNSNLLIYLNRLSDLLFVLARYQNLQEGEEEQIWQPGEK